MDTEFADKLIKGRITEIIFDQMFRTSGRFDIIPFGYETTLPQLAQYQNNLKIKEVLDNIKHSPDFVLISHDRTAAFLVEVKYCYGHSEEKVVQFAKDVLENHYDPSWVFVADSSGFYFESSHEIENNLGKIKKLEEINKWGISGETLEKYLNLLNKYVH